VRLLKDQEPPNQKEKLVMHKKREGERDLRDKKRIPGRIQSRWKEYQDFHLREHFTKDNGVLGYKEYPLLF